MSKDPAFLFYTSDFLTGTMFMSTSQVGIYIRLLCAQHQHGGLISKADFESMIGSDTLIRSKFVETDDGYFNQRLMEEMERRSVKCSNLSANAKQRWDKEKQKQCKSNTKEDAIVMPTEDEDETEDVIGLNRKSIEQTGSFLEQHLLDQWGQKEGRLNALRMQELVAHAKKHGWPKVFEVIEQAGRRNACNVAYVTACLEPKSKQSEHERVRAELIERDKQNGKH